MEDKQMAKYSKAETELWNRLQNGEIFGTYTKPTNPVFIDDIFWDELFVYGFNNQYIGWRHYGESANKNTKANLHWILTTIFNMTAEEFLKTRVHRKRG